MSFLLFHFEWFVLLLQQRVSLTLDVVFGIHYDDQHYCYYVYNEYQQLSIDFAILTVFRRISLNFKFHEEDRSCGH